MNETGSLSNSTGTANNGDINWSTQDTYWRSNYTSRPYSNSNRNYTAYQPAYRYGVELYIKNPGKRFEDIDQSQLPAGWDKARGNSNLNWEDAQLATRDAYDRMYNNRVIVR